MQILLKHLCSFAGDDSQLCVGGCLVGHNIHNIAKTSGALLASSEMFTRAGFVAGPPVDWWALGVCLYEFLTGLPPFNDNTAEAVFRNILSRDLLWPEGEEALSEVAQRAIEELLNPEPMCRSGAAEVRSLEFFEDLAWDSLHIQEAPFVPNPEDATDTGYFEARNTMQHLRLSSFTS